jgi:hypothetical protein
MVNAIGFCLYFIIHPVPIAYSSSINLNVWSEKQQEQNFG